MRVLLIGGGGREHAVASALRKSPGLELFTVMSNESPGIADLSVDWLRCSETDIYRIVDWAREQRIEWAFIGSEDPLDMGISDDLEKVGIASVGPKKAPAQLETSKLFARRLMKKYDIPGQVQFDHFLDKGSLTRFLSSTSREFALKPVGLTAGKGVKVMGVHLASTAEAMQYGCEIIEQRIGGAGGLILEERLAGEEFTLQCFVDGSTVVPMPAVQDYKQAFEGNQGPNTGGMGSYSQRDGLLPFLNQTDYDTALDILRKMVDAVKAEGAEYKGILYGQFMLTPAGVKLVEINARLGDPEAINVIPLLQTDLADICTAIIAGSLDSIRVSFDKKATVCKYIVPHGYGAQPKAGAPLKVGTDKIAALGARVFFARVNRDGNQLLTTTSRAFAILGVSESVSGAESMVEQALEHVQGDFYVRHDIGKLNSSSSRDGTGA
jgi:phosphoribosylamine--glycine ligase